MGKASKWFRSLFGFKKPDPPSTIRNDVKHPKRRWGFFRNRREEKNFRSTNGADKCGVSHYDLTQSSSSVACSDGADPSRHAIAVAAASAAVAEAAVAAAQAAAAVVKLTSSGRSCSHVSFGGIPREEWAAVRIQASFRAYLARRALCALKALVKLQARVRGHIIRKQTADMLRGIQALLRAQARARSGREQYSESPLLNQKSSKLQCLDPATPEKFEQAIRANAKYDSSSSTPPMRTRMGWRRNELQSTNNSVTTSKDSTTHYTAPSPSSCEVQSQSNTKPRLLQQDPDLDEQCSVNSSLQYLSAASSSVGGTAPPPSYMACTESSRAKLRSHSAPKQRPFYERRNPSGVHGSERTRGALSLHSSFASKAYPGSGRLDRLGMPYDHATRNYY